MVCLVQAQVNDVLAHAGRNAAAGFATRARLHLEGGDQLRAIDFARAALALEEDCYEAHQVLASLALAGDDYLRVLARAHDALRPEAYLEIGVGDGSSLALASASTLALAIDPEPQVAHAVRARATLFRETSDHFFAARDVRAALEGRALRLAFIDGLHLFEYALRDFVNVERCGTPETVVLLHDCYPLDEATAARQRRTRFWSGDVWKVLLCLKKYRPDLAIHTLSAPPTGIAVIRGLDPSSTILADRLEELYREFIPLPYGVLDDDKRAALNLVPSERGVLQRLLA